MPMRVNRKSVLLIVAVAVASLVFWYFRGCTRTPYGQPPLTSLTLNNLDRFKSEFNIADDRTRLVLLLSPT